MTDVSRSIGMSTAAISQWMRGEYKGDNDAIDNKIYGFLALQKERKESPGLDIPFVATSVTKAVFEILKLCHLDNEIGVIYGESGLGKTKSVREYTRRHKDVILVEVDLGFSARTLFAEINRALGLSGIGHLHGLFEDAVARLRRSGRLLIIDEAEQLPYRALEMTRRLHDKAGIGIVLIGMPRLVENLRGRKEEYKQLYSRVGVAAQLSKLSKDDVTSLINSAMPGANGLTAAFYEESRHNARHLRMLLRRSDRLAKINKQKISREIIKKAAETLFI
jgi:hypothetical protein